MNLLNTLMNEVYKIAQPSSHQTRRLILENICRHGDTELIEHLIHLKRSENVKRINELEAPIDISLFNSQNPIIGRSPFHYLVRFGHADALKALFRYQKLINRTVLNYTSMSSSRWNILHDCAKHGHLAVLEVLFENIPSETMMNLLLQQTAFGSTPIHLSLVHGHEAVSERLIRFFQSKQSNQWLKVLEVLSLVNFKKQNVLQLSVERRLSHICDLIFGSIKEAELNLISVHLDREKTPSFLKILQSKDALSAQLFHYCCVQRHDQMFSQLFKFLQFGHLLDRKFTKPDAPASVLMRLLVSKDQVGNTPFHYAMGSCSQFCALLLFRYYLLALYEKLHDKAVQTQPQTTTTTSDGSTQKRGSRNPMNVMNNDNQTPIFVACKKIGIEALRYILLNHEDHDHDLTVKIKESVKEEEINVNFLALVTCSTMEQKQFVQKCVFAIRSTSDVLVDKYNFSACTAENAPVVESILEEFNKMKP